MTDCVNLALTSAADMRNRLELKGELNIRSKEGIDTTIIAVHAHALLRCVQYAISDTEHDTVTVEITRYHVTAEPEYSAKIMELVFKALTMAGYTSIKVTASKNPKFAYILTFSCRES